MSMRYKGGHGLGAFDAPERARANDLLGFQAQLVFPTSAFDQVVAATDPRVFVGGVRADPGLEELTTRDGQSTPRVL